MISNLEKNDKNDEINIQDDDQRNNEIEQT